MTDVRFPWFKHKRILAQIRALDPAEYLESGTLPADCGEAVADFAARFAAAARRQYSSTVLQRQAAYRALQSQINPHFLYNTLEAIRSEALMAGNAEIAEMTEKLSRYYRYSVSSRDSFVTIEDELFNIEDYFFIQQYRFGNRFALDKLLESEDLLANYLPKLTLQPLVENAIYHGLEQKKGAGRIVIRISGTEKKIYIAVEDDGVGMTRARVKELNDRLRSGAGASPLQRHGIALQNVNERLRLQFGDAYGLRLNSTFGCGTAAEIVIPRLTQPEADKESAVSEPGT